MNELRRIETVIHVINRCRGVFLTSDGEIAECARGTYQHSLLFSGAAWSGSDLKGKARQYSGRYAVSRQGLVNRLNKRFPEVHFYTDLVFDNGGGRHRRMLIVEDRQINSPYPKKKGGFLCAEYS